MRKIASIKKLSKDCEANFLYTALKYYYNYLVKKKNIIICHKAIIKNLANIQTGGELQIGAIDSGFTHTRDITLLNIRGSLICEGDFSIGRGCRFEVAENAKVIIGAGSYINVLSAVIITHKLYIGKNCAISWNCQFLDEDFHTIQYYSKKKLNDPSIYIGNNVWVGSGVSIFKGSYIPDGCVIAAGSIVKHKFTEQNALIAGNPAKVIKSNIRWS